ncbi:MAG: hypothetical protein JWP39_2261, partial [Jatrophihabitans sp.]|nr:hypothetical protein [Jatrophihabitans sp.]
MRCLPRRGTRRLTWAYSIGAATLKPGKDADVLIVDGDPLADLGVPAQVRHVLRAGELVNTAPARTGTPS